VPVALWAQSSAHGEALQREFDIIRHGLNPESVPARLTALIEQLSGQFSGYGDAANDALRAAAERGDHEIDVFYQLPPTAAEASRQLGQMLAEADEYCRHELITLATPEEQLRFRDWFLGEIIGQIEQDLAPTPWPEFSSPRVVQAEGTSISTSHDTEEIAVSGDLDLATAGNLRDRIRQSLNAGVRSLTLDLSNVSFLDSVGLSLLVATNQRLAERDERLALIVPPHLETLFEISGLRQVMEIKSSV
jgi:anti-anti-sigma factor